MSRAVVVAVVVAAVVAYAVTLGAPFLLYDDSLYITQNHRILDASTQAFFTLWSPAEALSGRYIEYFPLRDSIYWILWHGFDHQSWPFHVANLCAHATASVLVLRLALALRLSSSIATVAGLVFAVHPVHIESVAWIASLKDPLYVSLLLGSVLAYLHHLQNQQRRWFFLSLGLLVLSLLCKSMAFVAPLLFLVLERTHGKGLSKAAAARVFVVGVVCAGFVFFFLAVGRANHILLGPWGGTWATHYQLVLWVLARYLQQALLPTDFRIHYCFFMVGDAVVVRGVVGAVVVVAYAAVVVACRKRPLAFLLLCWGPICLLPVMNLVPFPALMADRYLYGASVAVAVAIAVGLARVPPRLQRVVTGAVVGTLLLVTAARASLWRDESLLWRDVVEDEACRDVAMPWLHLADTLSQHEPQLALAAFERAMTTSGWSHEDGDVRCEAHVGAAEAALVVGDAARAGRHKDAMGPACAWQREWLGWRIAVRNGDVDEALAAAGRAVAAKEDGGLVFNLALARAAKDDVDGAADAAARAVELDAVTVCPLLLREVDNPRADPRLVGVLTPLAPRCR